MSKRKAEEMADDGADMGYASLLKTGKFSDLTIKCKGKTFKAHKAIVCPRSKPFDAMVDSSFKEGKTGIITLADEDPEIFEKFITYIYTTNYSDQTSKPANKQPTSVISQSLLINTKVYVCAEKWEIPKLKTLAVTKFQNNLPSEGKTSSFPASLDLMFEETPEKDRELKDVAIKHAAASYHTLVKLEGFAKLCREKGDIAFEILEAVSAQGPLAKPCPNTNIQCTGKNTWVTVRTEAENKASQGIWHCGYCRHIFN